MSAQPVCASETCGTAGSSRRRAASILPLPLRDALYVKDVGSGETVCLTDQWAQQRVVAVFLRHVGCALCAQLASGIASLQPQLSRAGVELVAVSLGLVEEGREWLVRTGWPGTLGVASRRR